MSQDIINLIITILPSLGGIIGIVLSVILSIKKISNVISEFRQSNELKENNAKISALLKDNAELKKLNAKLLVELTKIKPNGWCDDEKDTKN